MRAFYYDHLPGNLPEGHRFPAAKYRLLRERIQHSGVIDPDCLLPAPEGTDAQIARAHDADYIRRFESGQLTAAEIRRIGLPWSLELVRRVRHMVGGTIAAARTALQDGAGVNLGGGTHHAYRDHGEGYCLYNDVAIAVRAMQAEGRIRRALVIDCDVHQGNGTAQIVAGDETVFTFSIHGANNFPFRKFPSDLDVGLPDGTGDEAYLEALAGALKVAFPTARPDLVFYLAGADPFVGDRLGRLALTKDGLVARDRLVFGRCRVAGTPFVVLLAGGYGRDIRDTVDIYHNTVALAAVAVGESAGAVTNNTG